MGLVLRLVKGSELTFKEMDDNLTYLDEKSAGDLATYSGVLEVNDEVSIPLSNAKDTPSVNVYKGQSIPASSPIISNADISGYDLVQLDRLGSITPSATTGTNVSVTLSAGNQKFASYEIGDKIIGNSGKAVIIDTTHINITTPFADTSEIPYGSWTIQSAVKDGSNLTIPTVSGTPAYTTINADLGVSDFNFTESGDKFIFMNDAGVKITNRDLSGASSSAPLGSDDSILSTELLTNSNIMVLGTDGNNYETSLCTIDNTGTVQIAKTLTIDDEIQDGKLKRRLNGNIGFVYDTGSDLKFGERDNSLNTSVADFVLSGGGGTLFLDMFDDGVLLSMDFNGSAILINTDNSTTAYSVSPSFHASIGQMCIAGNNMMITYSHKSDQYPYFMIYDESGAIIKGETAISTAYTVDYVGCNKTSNNDFIIVTVDSSNNAVHYYRYDNSGTYIADGAISPDAPAHSIVFTYPLTNNNTAIIASGKVYVLETSSSKSTYLLSGYGQCGLLGVDSSSFYTVSGVTVDENKNGAEIYYALSTDNTNWYIFKNGYSKRKVADNGSYNSSSTFDGGYTHIGSTSPSINCLKEGVKYNAVNRMNKAQLESAIDFFYTDEKIYVAIIFATTTTNTDIPSFTSITINGTNKNGTKQSVVGTDYECYQIDSSTIKIKALTSGDYGVRIV